MGIKDTVKEWASEQWNYYVKAPIAKKTEEYENQASQKWNEYSGKAQEQATKPFNYYREQEPFYRGLFWIALALLLILWIISGS
ncbi:hypothetical protein [endosymbiont GvMRE of Glomus versiforme]|uniref:hypothetical protein n=1 Tax=endosymbiont GvMRE of Glomus versiforme TaxID=2039283 RepID=UPI000EC5015A|nr:hypothetical protein [endosymbiont GvMRE of Glomus versiforme]RHZ36537.1 hypothetical protein GvMRE_I2g538 [endosymbiont GvMRE of Glomus versiforme]